RRRPARPPPAGGSPSPAATAGTAGPTARVRRPCPGTPPGAAASPPSRPPRSGHRSVRSAARRPGKAAAAGVCRSRLRLLAPDEANRIQLAGHGPPRAVEPLGDLVVAVAFHLEDGDLAQALVAEQVEEPLVLLGDLGRELRGGLLAHDLL